MNLNNIGVKKIFEIKSGDWFALNLRNEDIFNRIYYIILRRKAVINFNLEVKMNVCQVKREELIKLQQFSRKLKLHDLNANLYKKPGESRCQAKTSKGEQCKMMNIHNSNYCWYHHVLKIREGEIYGNTTGLTYH
jgi:hypothetical protein